MHTRTTSKTSEMSSLYFFALVMLHAVTWTSSARSVMRTSEMVEW